MDERADDPAAAREAAVAADLRVVLGRLIRRLREEAPRGDLSWSQTAVLGRLDREGPTTVTALARAEGVRQQSMGATVAALEAVGFVSGAPDPADGRRTLWSLTPACRVWIATRRAAREDWLSRAIHARLAPAEQDALAAAVALLARLVDA